MKTLKFGDKIISRSGMVKGFFICIVRTRKSRCWIFVPNWKSVESFDITDIVKKKW